MTRPYAPSTNSASLTVSSTRLTRQSKSFHMCRDVGQGEEYRGGRPVATRPEAMYNRGKFGRSLGWIWVLQRWRESPDRVDRGDYWNVSKESCVSKGRECRLLIVCVCVCGIGSFQMAVRDLDRMMYRLVADVLNRRRCRWVWVVVDPRRWPGESTLNA